MFIAVNMALLLVKVLLENKWTEAGPRKVTCLSFCDGNLHGNSRIFPNTILLFSFFFQIFLPYFGAYRGPFGSASGKCPWENAKVFELKGFFEMQVVFDKEYFKITLKSIFNLDTVW